MGAGGPWNGQKRSGREGQTRRSLNACVVAFGGCLGTPTGRRGVANIIADSRRFSSSDSLAKSTLCGGDGRHLTEETSPRFLLVCLSPQPLSRITSVVPQDAHLGYDLGFFR